MSSTTAFFRISITCSLSPRCELCTSATKFLWWRFQLLKLLVTANELVSLHPNLLDLKTSLMDSINPNSLSADKHLEHSAGMIWGFLLYKLMHRQLELCSSLYERLGTTLIGLANLVDFGMLCSKSSPCGCVFC